MVLYSDGQSNSVKRKLKRSTRLVPVHRFNKITGRNKSQKSQNQVETKQEPIETRKEWIISITEKMDETLRDDEATSWDELCIYKVPHYLQENDKKSYFPQTVSLGPYHHGHKHLLPMERHKWRAVNMVMQQTKHHIEMYIDAMIELEERARACYEGPIDMSSNKFTEMLVLDGCFVLELFRVTVDGFPKIGGIIGIPDNRGTVEVSENGRTVNGSENGVTVDVLENGGTVDVPENGRTVDVPETGYAPNDPVFAMRGLIHSIQRDMIMLENQLPLFVLDRLLELQLGTQNQTNIVAKLAVKFFEPLMPTREALTKPDQSEPLDVREEVVDSNDEQLHCLDVFHRSLFQTFKPSLTPSDQKPRRYMSFRNISMVDKRQQQLIHCVTELKEAGVKFRRKITNQFLDITFNKGYLEIPKLLIHDGTKSLFSNLIAYEQCHNHSSDNITSYMVFMDNLINSSTDVSYLHHCGIIEHWLGSDAEVADLFNRLCKEVVFNPKDSYLSQLSGEVNRYYSRPWSSLKATLRHKYFSNPWAYFSFLAAVALLIFTFSQTFYAIYAYYKPSS